MYEFTSPFTEYLCSNFVPSSLDRAQIQELLKEPEMEAAKLDNEILRLQSQLDEVKKHKARLDEAIHEHYQLLTPFRRLPDDILREMFLWCLPDTNNAVMSAVEAPLILGRVCSRWRTLAYHTPRLWATLHIPLPVPPSLGGFSFYLPNDGYQKLCADFEQKFQRHCDAVHDWLDRSGNCSLSISVNPRESVPTGQNRYVRTYLSILLKYSHRWRSLEVSIPTGEYSSFFSAIPQSSIPRLEFLHLKFSRRAAQENVWTKCGILRGNNLRVLHLAQFPYRLSTIETDWSRITHLILSESSPIRNRRITMEEAYFVFSRCTNLRHCVMDIIDNADAVNPSGGVISLPHLESLAIMDGALSLGQLFENFDVPSLRDITYHTTFWPSTSRRSPLVILLQRSNNQVDTLTTDLQFFTASDLMECFDLLPSLEYLTNTRSRLGLSREQSRTRAGLPILLWMMKAILDIFLPDGNNLCRCPRLHTLQLKDTLLLTTGQALRFLQQRIEASRTGLVIDRLREVGITFTREATLGMEADFKMHVDDGLKLELTFPPPRKVSPGNFNAFNGLVRREMGSDMSIW